MKLCSLFWGLAALSLATPLRGELKVLPLGDSITEGSGYAQDAPSYRKALAKLLTDAGVEPRFLGARDFKSVGIANAACRFHTGLSGQRILSSSKLAGFLPGIEGWLEQAGDPDVITMMIGTNDLLSDAEPSGKRTFDHWCELVRRIVRERPNAWLIVSPLTPCLWTADKEPQRQAYADFNAAIRGLFDLSEQTLTVNGEPVRCVLGIPNAKGRELFGASARLRLADMEAAIGTPRKELYFNQGNDTVHPSQAGYDRMAAVWKAAIDALPRPLGGRMPPKPDTPALGAAARIPEAKGFTRLCSGALPTNAALSGGWIFSDLMTLDMAAQAPKNISRVAYYVERVRPDGSVRHVWVEMDAPTILDAKGLPSRSCRLHVTGMRVRSNMPGVTDGDDAEGILQFTPHFISPEPTEGADCGGFDWNDTMQDHGAYGAFQLFRLTPGGLFPAETLFAYNRWATADGGADELQFGPLGQHLGYNGAWRGGDSGKISYNGIFSADWPTLSTRAYTLCRMEVWVR